MAARPATVLLVTGPPATGKSTIARRLAGKLGWPLVAKDEVKESLFDTLGTGDREWSRRLSLASYALLFVVTRQCARSGVSLVLEGNFRKEHAAQLRAIVARDRVRVLQVAVVASTDAIVQRMRRRAERSRRHPGHLDHELAREVSATPAGDGAPLDIEGRVLRFDTTMATRRDTDALIESVLRELED